ncbi:MAG: hypothetical protein COV45_05810 [Deltaproteobacteria bacterium CG11_big_fil_rev_8_21_14_0_20_47_16]|nr:MAG: hypothetical protein COV45_05810 [Deltaproteobacteria bacterium CG11_big_fil_rev_8_21_14_0_20_47_16]
MTKRSQILSVLFLTLTAVGLYYAFFFQGKEKNEIPSKDDAIKAIQNRAERAYKKAYLAPMITTYEKILIAAPNSLDTQKKLVKAYLEIGDTEKAKPLLERLSKSNDSDAEQYKQQLEMLP